MASLTKAGVIIVLYATDKVSINIDFAGLDVSVIVVDNTPGQDLRLQGDRMHYIPLGRNVGIAGAQNAGIRKALELGCEYLIFFDQDTEAPSTYPADIVAEYRRIRGFVPALFALGPTAFNGRTGLEYKSNIHTYTDNGGFSPRREIISSGSCVAADRIAEVGLPDSSLFIDYVDYEWCWRAASKGLCSGITSRVCISHYVGQKEIRFLNQQVIISSPARYFYQERNYMWLLRLRHVPLQWKVNTGIKHAVYPLIFPFRLDNWAEIYRQKARGFLAGLKRKP